MTNEQKQPLAVTWDEWLQAAVIETKRGLKIHASPLEDERGSYVSIDLFKWDPGDEIWDLQRDLGQVRPPKGKLFVSPLAKKRACLKYARLLAQELATK